MKFSIVTFLRAYNHGAVLQCYALHKKLCDLGMENEVLDYCPAYFRRVYNIEHLSKWKWFPGTLLGRIPKFLHMRAVLSRRNRGFERFIKRNICLSEKQYYSTEEIKQAQLSYDAYIAGSDQVWSNIWTEFDPIFFLDFPAANQTKKLSYAASFGFEEIPTELKLEYKRRLKNWGSYSVREKSGMNILFDLLGVQSVQCCDPTLLLSKQEWKNISTIQKRRKPYILTYYVNSCEEVFKQAKRLAEEKELDIVSVTSMCTREHLMGEYQKQYEVKHKRACSPDEFLGLLSQAEYVITDSFHGTVFSLIFHKPFLTLTNVFGRINNRAIDLMNYVGVGDRKLENGLKRIEQGICWEMVDQKLQDYREESLQYLKNITQI